MVCEKLAKCKNAMNESKCFTNCKCYPFIADAINDNFESNEKDIKEKLLAILQFDSSLLSKEYRYFDLENGNIQFSIESTRKYEIIEEEFTKEEFDIVKKIFKIN